MRFETRDVGRGAMNAVTICFRLLFFLEKAIKF